MAAVAAGLEAFSGVKGRLQRRAGKLGAEILDDTYNANPDSVRAGRVRALTACLRSVMRHNRRCVTLARAPSTIATSKN